MAVPWTLHYGLGILRQREGLEKARGRGKAAMRNEGWPRVGALI
jgi:hypothetical protein